MEKYSWVDYALSLLSRDSKRDTMKKNKAPLYFFYRLLNSIRVYLNHNYIASLSRYYLELASGYIFNIKIYQFLSIVFIYVAVIPIQIDWSLYIEVFNNLSENLGTLRGVPIKYIKLESHINYILCSSHRSLLGAFFWTYILMVLILFIICIIKYTIFSLKSTFLWLGKPL